jgi:hypothetical protein
MLYSQSRADTVQIGAYQATAAIAQARVAAFDAKSNESLTLIARGSGQAFESEAITAIRDATSQLATAQSAGVDTTSREAFDRYSTVHYNIRKLDDGGQWDDAVKLATGSQPDGSNAAFAAFDTASQQALAAKSGQITDDLRNARTSLAYTRWLVLLAGLFAAAAIAWGFSRRLREYR